MPGITRWSSGASVLATVLVMSLVTGIVAFAYHSQWRGSARTLFSVQEHRELINLARSSLAEAYFKLQVDLDHSRFEWFDWCTAPQAVPNRTFRPAKTLTNSASMSSNASLLQYTTGDVSLERIVPVPRKNPGAAMGIVDLRVTVGVRRTNPYHEAQLTMVERRSFWLADDLGPFGASGRHVEVSPTAALTTIEEK